MELTEVCIKTLSGLKSGFEIILKNNLRKIQIIYGIIKKII